MELLSIDNVECRGMEKAEFARISRETVGDVLIVASTQKKSFFDKSADASLVTACFDKTTDGKAKVGLTLAHKEDKLVITKIAGNSLAAGSDLTIGMNIVAINDEDAVGMSKEDALSRFAATRGLLTILAKRPVMAPGSFVTASIVKDSNTTSVGIRLGQDDGLVKITYIAPLLAASFTDLTEGMVVEAVNGVNCSTMKLKEVNALFAKSTSIITILARTTADISVGRASFKSTRSLASNRSILSRSSRGSARSVAYQERRESTGSSFASSASDPALFSAARAAPDGNDSATMDRVAPSPAKKTIVQHQQQRSSPVPALVAIESRDVDNSAWC